MNIYNVAVVVDGLDPNDAALDKLFAALPDAVPSSVGGAVSISSPVEASSEEDAAFALVVALEDLFPDAVMVRLDQDLVSIPDIAERVDRSRESIRLFVEGKRGPGSFPVPIGTVGDGIRVWPWATVVEWFEGELGLVLDENLVRPAAAAVVDACLAARRRPRRAHSARITWQSAGAGAEHRKSERDPYRIRPVASVA